MPSRVRTNVAALVVEQVPGRDEIECRIRRRRIRPHPGSRQMRSPVHEDVGWRQVFVAIITVSAWRAGACAVACQMRSQQRDVEQFAAVGEAGRSSTRPDRRSLRRRPSPSNCPAPAGVRAVARTRAALRCRAAKSVGRLQAGRRRDDTVQPRVQSTRGAGTTSLAARSRAGEGSRMGSIRRIRPPRRLPCRARPSQRHGSVPCRGNRAAAVSSDSVDRVHGAGEWTRRTEIRAKLRKAVVNEPSRDAHVDVDLVLVHCHPATQPRTARRVSSVIEVVERASRRQALRSIRARWRH